MSKDIASTKSCTQDPQVQSSPNLYSINILYFRTCLVSSLNIVYIEIIVPLPLLNQIPQVAQPVMRYQFQPGMSTRDERRTNRAPRRKTVNFFERGFRRFLAYQPLLPRKRVSPFFQVVAIYQYNLLYVHASEIWIFVWGLSYYLGLSSERKCRSRNRTDRKCRKRIRSK